MAQAMYVYPIAGFVFAMCVCLHVMKLSYFSCEFFFFLLLLLLVLFGGEENRHKIEDETPIKCTYDIICCFGWNFVQKFFQTHFCVLFFLKFAGFLCVIRLDSYANELPFQSTKEFDACEKFAFFPILMFKVPIPSGNRLSGQLQNKISTFPGKLCCFVTSAKKKTHTQTFFE